MEKKNAQINHSIGPKKILILTVSNVVIGELELPTIFFFSQA